MALSLKQTQTISEVAEFLYTLLPGQAHPFADQSISFALIGKQYTKSIKSNLNRLIDFNLSIAQKRRFINLLTEGNIEHGYQLTVTDLKKYDLPVKTIKDKKLIKILTKIISSKGKEGVSYYRYPNWKRKLDEKLQRRRS